MENIMSKDMLIDAAHQEEIRIAIVSNNKLDKFDFETSSKTQVKGNIYLAKVIRVEPSLQAAFIDYGGNRHGFLSFSEIHHDYFQIPVGDREELEEHIQNAIASHAAELGQTIEELEPKDIAKLRYQFYRRYKIQEVIKKRQIMLVQVTKEERGNKGAALTTYISLAGRYCVLMPNTEKGSGVSRKITDHSDRTKLKKIVSSLQIKNGSVVIRTAGVGHTKSEIKKDFDYLVSLWNEIREITLKSTAPCLIHEESSIIKRSLRDMYTKDVEEIVVEGEEGYKTARAFMKKLMPSHAKKIKLYDNKETPLFSKYKLDEQINQVYSTRVDLPSGGYLVINNTEALIAIDVNSGKSTRERNIAGTALKTNLEAAVEIARQCRLRDLAGLVVVDFIDMDDKRNNSQVERCMKEALRNDKAKIQVGTISGFGLLEFSRQRLRSSITDANMVVCPYCRGTGFTWSEESLAIQILRKIEEISTIKNAQEINVTLSPDVAIYLLNHKRSFISMIESRGNFTINFITDPHIAPIDFQIEHTVKPVNIEEENNVEIGQEAETKQEIVTESKKRKTKTNQKVEKQSAANLQSQGNTKELPDTAVKKVSKKKKQSSKKNNSQQTQNVVNIPLETPSGESNASNVIAVTPKKERKKTNNNEATKKGRSTTKTIYSKTKQKKVKQDATVEKEEAIEVKEGSIDFNPITMLDDYQKDIASKVIETYGKEREEVSDIKKGVTSTPKKRSGWWQKLLKKPETNE